MAKQDDPSSQADWQGLRELDRAISENRLTAYSWKKAWADPWGRAGLVAFGALSTVFIIYVVLHDIVL
jgi:hypothetical protein